MCVLKTWIIDDAASEENAMPRLRAGRARCFSSERGAEATGKVTCA